MTYGIYAIPYGDTFAFIPAIYQQGIYCEVAPLFWKYQYLMKDKIKEIFPMKQTESQSEKLNNDLTKEIMTKLFKDDQFKKEVEQLRKTKGEQNER